MTSLLCFLYYILDQFCNPCDKTKQNKQTNKKFYSVQPFLFHLTKCQVRLTDLLPAVSTFHIKDFQVIMSYNYRKFQECFKNFKRRFGGQSSPKATVSRCFRRFVSGVRSWKAMTVVVAWHGWLLA